MRRNFGSKPFMYPQPVLIIATYDENGVVDAMNAAWGITCDYDKIALYLSASHKTTKNILHKKAFTVSMATVDYVKEADYFGVVSANKVADKFEKSGCHAIPSEFVDAPIIQEFPMALECVMESWDEESECMIGKIVNVSADESVCTDDKIDPYKLKPIAFDPIHSSYMALGAKVGNAFKDGFEIK